MGRRRRSRKEFHRADAEFLSPPLAHRLISPVTSVYDVLDLEDRRQHHPLGLFRPAQSATVEDRNVNIKKPAKFRRALPFGLQFAVPDKVAVCVRRKQRREVIFAKGKGGGRARRRPHRNWHSKVSC